MVGLWLLSVKGGTGAGVIDSCHRQWLGPLGCYVTGLFTVERVSLERLVPNWVTARELIQDMKRVGSEPWVFLEDLQCMHLSRFSDPSCGTKVALKKLVFPFFLSVPCRSPTKSVAPVGWFPQRSGMERL